MPSLKQLAATVGTDATKETDGAWMDIADGVRWRVRSNRSKAARAFVAKHAKTLWKWAKLPSGIPEEVSAQYDTDLVATALVTAWEGMDDDTGAPLPCTPETVRQAIGAIPILREKVVTFAADDTNFGFDREDVADVGETSPPSSVTG